MQQVTFNINEEADLPFLKKLLESLKGVSNFKVENKSNTVNEDWFDEEFLAKQTDSHLDELLEKSLQESREGKVTPFDSEEMIKEIQDKNLK